MKANAILLMPLNCIQSLQKKFDKAFDLNKLKSIYTSNHMRDAIYKSLMSRIVFVSIPTLLSIPGMLYVISKASKDPILYDFILFSIPSFTILLLLSGLVVLSSILSKRFVNKIFNASDTEALTYRFLLQKKRSLIYSAITSIVIGVLLFNNNHFVYLLSLQLVSFLIIYIPLYYINKNLTIIKVKGGILGILSIINPQYFNRFRSIKNAA